MSKLTEQEAQSLHERNDHVPYRRGCEICISSQGRQRAHWRKSFTNIYSANFDLAGPFVSGRSFDPVASGRDRGLGYRYTLVCAYTIPDLARSAQQEDGLDLGVYQTTPDPPELEPADLEVMKDLDELQCSFDPSEIDDDFVGVKVVDRRVRKKGPELGSSSLVLVPNGGSDSKEDDPEARAKVVTRSLYLALPLRTKKGSSD